MLSRDGNNDGHVSDDGLVRHGVNSFECCGNPTQVKCRARHLAHSVVVRQPLS
jgi:hypothetical protein